MSLNVHSEQGTQYQEQRDDNDLKEDTHNKVFGRFTGILAGEAALHQVLIQTCCGNHHEDTGNKLFPEVGSLLGIVKEEYTRGIITPHSFTQACKVITQALSNEIDTQYDRQDEAETLQGVGPDDGLHATLQGVQENESDGHDDVDDKGNVQR